MANNNNRKNLNVPNLRFPEFQGEWETVSLKDICDKIGDGIHSTPQYDENGDYFFINGNNFVEGRIQISETTKRVTKKEAEQYNIKYLTGSTILISINGTIGNLALYNNEPVILGKSACYINPQKREDRLFIFYQLGSKRVYNYFVSELTGSTIKNLSLKSIRQTAFHLPSIEEQNKISSLLSLIDQRIETQNKIIEKLESLIKGIRQILFKETATWKSCKIGDILKIGSGKDYKHLKNGNIPVYGTGGYMLSVNDYLHDGESVCIGRKGTIDRPLFLNEKFWTVDTLFYTYNFQGLLPRFCYYLFGSINWLKYNEASGVPSLSKETIESIQIRLPNMCEQERICSILDVINSKLEIENKVFSVYQVQKKYLLQQMFV